MLRTTGALVGAGTGATLLGGAPAEAQQTVDFGEVSDGSSDVRTVSQPNPTGRPLPVTGIEITGTDAAQFSVVRGDESVTLQPDESHTIAVRFAPTSPGEKSAAIRVAIAGGSSRTAGQLAGTGVSEATDETTADSSSTSQRRPTVLSRRPMQAVTLPVAPMAHPGPQPMVRMVSPSLLETIQPRTERRVPLRMNSSLPP